MRVDRDWEHTLRVLPAYFDGGERNVFSGKSQLWTWITAQREKQPLSTGDWLKLMATFLAPSSKQTSGVSDWRRELSPSLLAYFNHKVDPEFLRSLPMPATGSPATFELHGEQVSTAHLWNVTTVQTFRDRARDAMPSVADVVEIGAGYGAAALMRIQLGGVRSYTIIDLPDNLVNSLYYLTENLPGWRFEIVEQPLHQLAENTVYFLVPGYISSLGSCQFDLAVNSDSIGEMPGETGGAYVQWIFDHLRDGGVFLSKNGHRRGIGHLESVRDYGYDRFEVVSFGPSPVSSSAVDDFSHVAVLRKGGTPARERQWEWLETLSNLYACGIDADVSGVTSSVVAGNLSAGDEAFLTAAGRFYRGANLVPDGRYGFVLGYLMALRAALRGRFDRQGIVDYLASGRSDIGRTYALMLLLHFGDVEADRLVANEANVGALHWLREFVGYSRASALKRWAAFNIRLDNIRKKLTPYEPFRPSLLVRTKNVAMNLKEGRLTLFRT